MKRVFISYSSKDKWVREWLVPQLRMYEVEVIADYLTFKIGRSSLQNIEDSIEEADFTFFIVSPNWLASEWTELENLIIQTDSPSNRKGTFFVLRLEACELPRRLKPFTYLDLTDSAFHESQIQRLMDQLHIRKTTSSISGPKPEHISLHRLPDTSGLLFGRESELALLDKGWTDGSHLICFVAQGGEGKTALTRRWVNDMERDNFRGAERVYAWSFYSQGTHEDRQVSGDLFLADALNWFGDPATANSQLSATQKAQRLAELIQQQRTLLILDGVEPLQYPLGEPHNGRIRDEGLRVLLKELAQSNQGLCMVSTRVWIKELDSYLQAGTVVQQRLPRLSKAAGVSLLKQLGVTKGLPKDFEDAVEEYHGHALALTLLGKLLNEYEDGDIRKRDVIPALEEEDDWGGHARRVLAWYEEHFQGKPELNILRILGLFDRPAEKGAVDALRKGAAIAGVTDALAGLNEMAWRKACKHLRSMGLLEDGESLDCHPLIREYFARQLSMQQPEAWQAAHLRLYEYYTSLPAKHQPDTLEEMEPLYRAMGHGCKAGRYQEVHDEVYWERIKRRDEHFDTSRLGAFSSSLAAISGQFMQPWRFVRPELSEGARGFLLNEAGSCLRALSRLREAIEPMDAGMEMAIEQKNWKNAAISASNLSELRLTIGDVGKAVEDGHASVRYADDSKEPVEMRDNRTTLADALHQAGRVQEAESIFREAEAMQLQRQPQYPILYSIPGYWFCDLLLWKGEWREVKERAERTLEWAKKYLGLLSIALDHLSLGRAAHLQALAEVNADFEEAKTHLDQAVEGLRKAGQMDDLPRGLLARAALYRSLQVYPAAGRDLAEVLDIAENGEMRLHLTDFHLESARLRLAMGKPAEAIPHYEAAKQLIAESGYHRRDGELEELRVTLGLL